MKTDELITKGFLQFLEKQRKEFHNEICLQEFFHNK